MVKIMRMMRMMRWMIMKIMIMMLMMVMILMIMMVKTKISKQHYNIMTFHSKYTKYDVEVKTMVMMTIDETSLGQAKGPPLSPEQAEMPGIFYMTIKKFLDGRKIGFGTCCKEHQIIESLRLLDCTRDSYWINFLWNQ